MNQKLITVMLVLLLLGGCAASPDCTQPRLLGAEIAGFGLPSDADRHNVSPACRETFQSEWERANNAYCRPENGFAIGRSDRVYYGVCRDVERFERHYRLGRSIRSLEIERERLTRRLAASDAGDHTISDSEAARIRMRLRVIARDLPELMTLARIHGLVEAREPSPAP